MKTSVRGHTSNYLDGIIPFDVPEEEEKKISIIKWALFIGLALGSFLIYYLKLLPGHYNELLFFFLVFSVSCNFIPFPTYLLVIYISHDFSPFLITGLGSIGATISGLMEYNFFSILLRFDKVSRIRKNGHYQKYAGYFEKFPFFSILVASFLPLPFDFIRIMAITQKYSKWRFAAATFLGRIPRIFIIAYLGKQIPFAKTLVWVLLGGIVLFEVARRSILYFKRQPASDQL
ncbi:MAG: VTT domain-containing protein [Calditrichaeota bacterium]|nr:VTT domain-containing protein [Calditrichota bacterium]